MGCPWTHLSWCRGTTSPISLFSFPTIVIKSFNFSSFFFKFIFSQYANRSGFQWLLFQCNSFQKSKNAKHVCVYGNVDGRPIRRGALCLFAVLMCPGFWYSASQHRLLGILERFSFIFYSSLFFFTAKVNHASA